MLDFLLIFRWYRKMQGGKWYKVQLIDSEGGIAGPIEYWTRETDDDMIIIKEEDYK